MPAACCTLAPLLGRPLQPSTSTPIYLPSQTEVFRSWGRTQLFGSRERDKFSAGPHSSCSFLPLCVLAVQKLPLLSPPTRAVWSVLLWSGQESKRPPSEGKEGEWHNMAGGAINLLVREALIGSVLALGAGGLWFYTVTKPTQRRIASFYDKKVRRAAPRTKRMKTILIPCTTHSHAVVLSLPSSSSSFSSSCLVVLTNSAPARPRMIFHVSVIVPALERRESSWSSRSTGTNMVRNGVAATLRR